MHICQHLPSTIQNHFATDEQLTTPHQQSVYATEPQTIRNVLTLKLRTTSPLPWFNLDAAHGASQPQASRDIFLVVLPNGTLKRLLLKLGICTYPGAWTIGPVLYWLFNGTQMRSILHPQEHTNTHTNHMQAHTHTTHASMNEAHPTLPMVEKAPLTTLPLSGISHGHCLFENCGHTGWRWAPTGEVQQRAKGSRGHLGDIFVEEPCMHRHQRGIQRRLSSM